MNSNTFFTGPLLAGCLTLSLFPALGFGNAQSSQSARSPLSPNSSSVVHRAPYHPAFEDFRENLPAAALQRTDPDSLDVATASANTFPPPRPRPYSNVRVNQDHNAYPKTLAGIAVDPTNNQNVIVSTFDDRIGSGQTHDYSHLSSDGGLQWADDITPYVQIYTIDPYDDDSPLFAGPTNFQFSRDLVFDSTGTAYTALSSAYSVNVSKALNHGRFPAGTPSEVDSVECPGGYDVDECDIDVRASGIVADQSGTASDGSVYVFYNIDCDSTYPCGGLEGESTAIAVALTAGPGVASFQGGIWSQSYYADIRNPYEGRMIIDDLGMPYLFFMDGGDFWESKNGVVGNAPLFLVVDLGLNNSKWGFREWNRFDCAEHSNIVYCAFTSNKVGTATAATTPSIFMAAIDLTSGVVTYSRVNNDSFTGGKDHFNPSIAVTSDGTIYVGWFDNRRDPTNLKVDYFVGKSADGGKTFPTQRPVNDVIFDPTLGGSNLTGALAAKGKDGVIAAWSDTRDGSTQQIWSQIVHW